MCRRSPVTVTITPERLCSNTMQTSVHSFNMHNGRDNSGGLVGSPGLCRTPLRERERELSGLAGPQPHPLSRSQKVRRLTSSSSLRHDVISRCLWVVTLELTEGEQYLMNTGSLKKMNRFFEVNYVI